LETEDRTDIFSETLLHTRTTQRYIPEDGNLDNYCKFALIVLLCDVCVHIKPEGAEEIFGPMKDVRRLEKSQKLHNFYSQLNIIVMIRSTKLR
jgi:hypothetical protein